jgi:hypothetical protein
VNQFLKKVIKKVDSVWRVTEKSMKINEGNRLEKRLENLKNLKILEIREIRGKTDGKGRQSEKTGEKNHQLERADVKDLLSKKKSEKDHQLNQPTHLAEKTLEMEDQKNRLHDTPHTNSESVMTRVTILKRNKKKCRGAAKESLKEE